MVESATRLYEARRELQIRPRRQPQVHDQTLPRRRRASSAVYLAQRERIIEGMRLAGVPEGMSATLLVTTFVGRRLGLSSNNCRKKSL